MLCKTPTNLLQLISLAIWIPSHSFQSAPLCDPTAAYMVQLQKGYTSFQVTPRKSIKFSFRILPKSVPCDCAYMRHYRSLCRSSISTQPGDKCVSRYSFPVHIKQANFLEMVRTQTCLTYPPCAPGACYGDTSSLCNSSPDVYKQAPRAFLYAEKTDPMWFHDSCVQDTECLFSSTEALLMWTDDKKSEEVTLSIGNEKKYKYKESDWARGTIFLNESGNFYQCKSPYPLHSGVANASCFKGDREYSCITTSDMDEDYKKGFVFKMPLTGNTWMDANVRMFLPNVKSVEDHEMQRDNIFKLNSPTIKDFERMISMLSFSQLQQEYNALSLAESLSQTQDLIIRAIDALSRKDMDLVPLLAEVRGVSRRHDVNKYIITPCFADGDSIDPDEVDGKLVKDPVTGKYEIQDPGSVGRPIPRDWFGPSKVVKLFTRTKLSVDRSMMPKLTEAIKFVRGDAQDFADVAGGNNYDSWVSFSGIAEKASLSFWDLIGVGFQTITNIMAWGSFMLWCLVVAAGLFKILF